MRISQAANRSRTPLIVLLTLISLALAPATRPARLDVEQFDYKALLGDPPADDSAAHKQEVDRMLALQAARTPEQEKRCNDELGATPFIFSSVLGTWFTEKDLPVTADLLNDATRQAKPVWSAAKKVWRRQRPPVADARIHPCVPLEKSDSYPSGNAASGILWATILSDMFPEHHDELMALGHQLGDDRFLAGMHYPSDVAAGQKLGAEIAKRLLATDEFKAKLEKAKAECTADAKK